MPSSRRSSKRPYGRPHEEIDPARVWGNRARIEPGPGGEDHYVAVPRPSDRVFTCPGCRGEISGATAHVVTWAVEGILGAEAAADDRRHWHQGCWSNGRWARG